MPRDKNWYGWSIETIAAVYESNMAAKEYEQNLVDLEYVWAAARAEEMENRIDAT